MEVSERGCPWESCHAPLQPVSRLPKEGQYAKAITAYQEALRLRPDLATAHEYLGKAYLAKGMRREAEEQYRILQKLNPAMAAELLEQMRR